MVDSEHPPGDEELEEERRREGRLPLDEEIARKYDRERLRRIVVQGAGHGEPLDLATRSEMERLLPGHDFSHVRLYQGTLAEELTTRYRADAITISNTGMIMMRGGPHAAPGTTSGRALLAHELTHVAQAQRGMQFSRQGGGEGAHEHEAHETEARAATPPGSESSDQGSEIQRAEARRRVIVERVLEIMREKQRLADERNGTV